VRGFVASVLIAVGVGAILVGGVTAAVGLLAMGSAGPKDVVMLVGLVVFVGGLLLAAMAGRRLRSGDHHAPS